MMKRARTIMENEGLAVMAIVLIIVGVIMILQDAIIGVLSVAIGLGILLGRGMMMPIVCWRKRREAEEE